MVATLRGEKSFGGLVAGAGAFSRVLAEAELAAASDVGILLTGETGTGKGVVARAIHAASRRSAGPFITVDCAALPESTLQSELFGHTRGSFSGAERDRIGRFEAAGGGTLFLDGIDELDLGAQAKLLRAVEEREVHPLGESRPRSVDFRMVASAAPGLARRVSEGTFRSDLYWRIKVVELELPPLRERREDLSLLAAEFLEDCARRFGKSLKAFSPRAREVMAAYDWPGNVRELASLVEAAAAAARGEVLQESDLPVHIRTAVARKEPSPPVLPDPVKLPAGEEAPPGFSQRVEEFQRTLVLEALGRSSWSHREAARELGLERHQLKYLCAKLGIRRGSTWKFPAT